MWKSKTLRGDGGATGGRAKNTKGDEKKKRGRRKEFRFLVVNPFANFLVNRGNRRRLENWRDMERNRVSRDGSSPPARPPPPDQTEEAAHHRSGIPPAGDLDRRGRFETEWKDREQLRSDEMRRKEKRVGAVPKGRAGGVGCMVGSDKGSAGADRTGLELLERAGDAPCKETVSATENWDESYEAFRCQVATDRSKQHSTGDDLFRLRKGRREVFKQLQDFGYIDADAAIDDVFIVRGFDRLCRDVCEWRRQAIDALRLRHKQMDDAIEEEEEEETEDAAAAAAEAEEHVRHLVATRRHIDNYKARIAQVGMKQLSAKDAEIARLRDQLQAARTLSFAVQMENRPPVEPDAVFTDPKVTSRVFRGCTSSDITFWAQRTAVFPDQIRQSMLEEHRSSVATKADPGSKD